MKNSLIEKAVTETIAITAISFIMIIICLLGFSWKIGLLVL